MPLSETSRILHQQLALDSYLRTMLEKAVPESQADLTAPVKVSEKVRHLYPVPKIEQEIEPGIVGIAQLEPRPVKPLALMPNWTQDPFQVLLFRLDNFIMGAPLIQLASTQPCAANSTRLPGQPAWLVGLQRVQQANLAVLDSQYILLGKKSPRRNLAEQPYAHLLVSQHQRWALACDELLSVVTLSPEVVRWRTERSRRPWLIGSVIEDLTLLIDLTRVFPRP